MPKNTKKAKNSSKSNEATTRPLEFKEGDDQEYAQVTNLLGNCQVQVTLLGSKSSRNSDKIGIIRGSFIKKKIFIRKDDIVLVSLRDFDDKKVDIIHKYNTDEVHRLKKFGEIQDNNVNNNGNNSTNNECECGITFDETSDIQFDIDAI